ncbi:MAG: DUF4037 domain-containing protein [Anaerolineales bacterium]
MTIDSVMDLPFIPGRQLSELFFYEAVKPIMAVHYPLLVYSAARLDSGSEVLGYDTPQSRDHGWGPRLQVFISEQDYACCADEIVRVLGEELPLAIHGYPTNFTDANLGDGWLRHTEARPIRHGVSVQTPRSFFESYLGVNPLVELSSVDWLLCPQQRLLTVTAGQVFHDGLGELELTRARLRYFPHAVWLHMLAAQWRRIAQEEPFMARCGDVGDELGSRLIAGRLVQELMRLAFLMERRYWPYSKWFGAAFAKLACAAALMPILKHVLNGQTWREREAHLTAAYEHLARMHNALAITPPLPVTVSLFHDRPYQVLQSDNFAEAIRAAITDPATRILPVHIGSVDQISDATDMLTRVRRLQRLRTLYETESEAL